MKVFFVFLLFAISINLKAQSSFNRIYPIESEFAGTAFYDVILSSDTLIVFGGAFPDIIPYRLGAFWAKLDTFGNLITYNHIPLPIGSGFTTDSQNGNIIHTADGGYAFIGADVFSYNVFLLKVNHNGELVFLKEYTPSPDTSMALQRIVEVNSDFYIVGYKQKVNGSIFQFDVLLLKTDKAGNLLWERTYGTSSYNEIGNTLSVLDENHIVIGGTHGTNSSTHSGPGAFSKGYTIHVDSLGDVLQIQQTPNNERARISVMQKIPSGWILGTSEMYQNGGPLYEVGSRIRLARTGEDINDVDWELPFPNSDNLLDNVLEIQRSPDGHWVALAQYLKRPPPTIPPTPGIPLSTVATMKFTSNGEMIWFRTDTIFPHPVHKVTDNFPGGLAVSPSGSIYVAAYANSYGYDPLRSYAWLLKITPDGCIDTLCGMTTDLDEIILGQGQKKGISVFPNPTDGPIYWSSPNASGIEQVEVWDATGKLQKTTSAAQTDGQIDVSHCPSGVFVLLFKGRQGQTLFSQKIIKQ